MSKIDVVPIIARHFDSLRDHSTGKRSIADLTVFLGIPSLACAAAAYYGVTLTSDALTAVLASFSIFAGLLLNLLLLVYTRAGEELRPDIFAANIRKFVRQLSDNIEFAVLVSVFVVICSLIGMITLKREPDAAPHAGIVVSALLVFLTANFLLTLLMVLKRIHMMLVEKLDRGASSGIRKAS